MAWRMTAKRGQLTEMHTSTISQTPPIELTCNGNGTVLPRFLLVVEQKQLLNSIESKAAIGSGSHRLN
jgi:hypothetical protein